MCVKDKKETNMKECVYYHWFNEDYDLPPWKDLRLPLITSIATLRAVSDVPIVVLDISEHERDWSDYPSFLNFEVQKIKPELGTYKNKPGWCHLSRLFDLEKYATSETVIYSDIDVLWIADPLPLSCMGDKFCFDGYNSGLFYYKPNKNKEFFEIFKSYTISALNSDDVRKIMKKFVPYDGWYYVYDEMILTYMANENKKLIEITPTEEHGCPRRFERTNLEKMKNIHLNGVHVRNSQAKRKKEKGFCRGLAGIIFKESYDNLTDILGERIHDMFTEQELNTGLNYQFSLIKESHKLLNSKKDDGHYDLMPQEGIIMI